LTPRGLAALVAAVVALCGALAVLAATSEDVISRDGLTMDDPPVLRFVAAHRSAWLVHMARWVTDVGAAGVLGVAAIVAAVVLWLRGARLIAAIAPGIALGLAATLAAVGKQLVDRPRPALGLRLVNESEASFPSGHTTDATAFFVALAIVVAVVVVRSVRLRALIVTGAALLAAAVGASRLELGVHWPTDVIAGFALGLATAIAVATGAVLISRAATPSRPNASPRQRAVALLTAQRHATNDRRIGTAQLDARRAS
jgi:undecaprenyl-diphosphatase